MISNKNKANFFLFFVLSLSVLIYGFFLYKNKGSIEIKENEFASKINNDPDLESGVTKFSDVEYKTFSKNNIEYITKGKSAYVSKNRPEIINLEMVHSFAKLKDGSILNIYSNKAQYLKNTKDINYYDNVKITNQNIVINSKSASFISNKNLIKLNDVVYNDGQNLIKADIVQLDTITNNLEMFMKNKKNRVYGLRKQK